MKPQIVLITGSNIGGAERVTVLYAKILKQAGLDVYLLLYQNGKSCDLKEFIPKDIPYEVVAGRIRYLAFYLTKRLGSLKPEVVFTTLFHVALSASVATWLLRKPYTFVVRDCNTPSRHGDWQIRLARILFKKCDVLVAQTEEMRQQMIEAYHLASEKVVTIYNPIDKMLIRDGLKETVNMNPHHCNYLAVGRIAPQKDYVTMLKAFAIVRKQQPNSHLYIIGPVDVAYKVILDQLIYEYQLHNWVFFEGFQINPFKYIEAADVFVLSSEYEGLPNVLMEAMYLGKPVVATRCIPFVQQVVKEGINGYTTKVGDYESFAEKMLLASKLKGMEKFIDTNKSDEKVLELFGRRFYKL